MIRQILLVIYFILSLIALNAQRNCSSVSNDDGFIKLYPQARGMLALPRIPASTQLWFDTSRREIEIPVAVHVVWRVEEEKVSRQKIVEQIEILNRDFKGENPDIQNVPDSFKKFLAENTFIRFRLDTITETNTATEVFKVFSDSFSPRAQPIKFTSLGGKDGFPCTSYLNIWIGNIKDGTGTIDTLFGYGSFPDRPDRYDGVVIDYRYFGRSGFDLRFNEGRTVTHEVGHWLNLKHLWGDFPSDNCSDDGVEDTPEQDWPTSGCPDFPQRNCKQTRVGKMFMNFMDYVNDPCMIMFTKGQKSRMRRCFLQFPKRSALLDQGQYYRVRGKFINTEVFDQIFVDKPDITQLLTDTLRNKSTVTWDESYKAETYNVYLREIGNKTWIKINQVSKNKVEIDGLKPNGLYELYVETYIGTDKVAESAPYLFINNSPYKKKRIPEKTKFNVIQ